MPDIKSRQSQAIGRDIIWIKPSLRNRDLKDLKQRPQQKQGDQRDQHPLFPGPAKGQKEQNTRNKIPRNMQPKTGPETLFGQIQPGNGRVIDQRDKRDGEEPEEEEDFCKQDNLILND